MRPPCVRCKHEAADHRLCPAEIIKELDARSKRGVFAAIRRQAGAR